VARTANKKDEIQMASRKHGSAPEGTARIRFVMLEADVPNSNLSEFAHTIANALKSSSYQKVLAAAGSPSAREHTNSASLEAALDEPIEEVSEVEAVASNGSLATKVPSKTRKPYVAKVKVIEVDLNSGDMPFEKYVEQKSPDQLIAKFLVIAVWFKEFRNLDEITADHVYTGFKKVGWGPVPDMTQPFRDLKKTGRGDYEGGKFKVNHIGIDFVEKMSRNS
jgi:hypothetical protein